MASWGCGRARPGLVPPRVGVFASGVGGGHTHALPWRVGKGWGGGTVPLMLSLRDAIFVILAQPGAAGTRVRVVWSRE